MGRGRMSSVEVSLTLGGNIASCGKKSYLLVVYKTVEGLRKILGVTEYFQFSSVQFSSVTQSCPTLCDPMDCSTPGLPVHPQLLESTQTHVHWVGDAIQPSHPLSSPSPPALNSSRHQGLFKWVSSSHQLAKVLAFQLQHQSLSLNCVANKRFGGINPK